MRRYTDIYQGVTMKKNGSIIQNLPSYQRLFSTKDDEISSTRCVIGDNVNINARDEREAIRKQNNLFEAFLIAARDGDVHIIPQLIEDVANIDARNEYGWDALGMAIEGESIDAVKMLLRLGANPNGAPLEGSLFGKTTPLMLAAQKGNIQIINILLDDGADINKRDYHDEATALIVATEFHQSDAVHVLLDRGATEKSKSFSS